ncbi:MAG TPA: extracellular solute-binding protein, partial [Candidatus Binataceae bacterium]|nr:extracellular solute-binding protein [Candidatus Binataceae bacterium]
RAQGSTGLAHLIAAGSIAPDVFIAITPGPMRIVLNAGKAREASPIARTEMVIAYSPSSRYYSALAHADRPGSAPWWKILESPGFRFGRTDPLIDPQGRNVVFVMNLAANYYRRPDLPDKILGPILNPRQIFLEPQVMARLQSGQLDAASAYETQPLALGLPFIRLPDEINLGNVAMESRYRRAAMMLNGKTVRPEPLVFYAAALTRAPHPELAANFIRWLRGPSAQAILSQYRYDSPGDTKPLVN